MKESTMTISDPRVAWVLRQEQIKHVRKIFMLFPEMDDRTGDVLAGCLATLMRGHDLSPRQEDTYRWWNAWLKAIDQGCFASIIEMSLAVRDLPAVVHDELVDACQRLRRGEDMTPRQAALWGNHVVKRWRA
jgi:hypothetical protein